uniref:Hflx-type G domain-containing protein n=1 Tax=Parascaris univalens TaxID=6257 RepID=A0A915CAL0_PARUN
MPVIALEMKATLVNVTDLRPSDPTNFRWYMKLRCMNCGEQPEHWQYVTISEWLEVPGSRGEANLIEKCKLCGRVNSLKIIAACSMSTVVYYLGWMASGWNRIGNQI